LSKKTEIKKHISEKIHKSNALRLWRCGS